MATCLFQQSYIRSHSSKGYFGILHVVIISLKHKVYKQRLDSMFVSATYQLCDFVKIT